MQHPAHWSCHAVRIIVAVFMVSISFGTSHLFAQHTKGKAIATIQYNVSVIYPQMETAILPDGRLIYNVTEHMPEYPGDLQAFLAANLRYPEDARKQKTEGRSVVRFIVSSDGNTSDAEIVRSSGNKLLDDESLRVTGLMQGWKPGMKDGNPVAVFFYLPVTYKLD